jgi:hypothetical protein
VELRSTLASPLGNCPSHDRRNLKTSGGCSGVYKKILPADDFKGFDTQPTIKVERSGTTVCSLASLSLSLFSIVKIGLQQFS